VRDKLIEQHIDLPVVVANVLKQSLPAAIDVEELISAGMLGLVQAARKYDTAKGDKFRAFASYRVHGAIKDHLRKLDWFPRGAHARGHFAMHSLDAMIAEDEHREPEAMIDNRTRHPIEALTARELPSLVRAVLNAREFAIVSMYYGARMTLKQIGAVIGVSESRVCQIRKRILGMLRGWIEWERNQCRTSSSARTR
jgi:RNA polymerase sigma factor for flagellar operon FliA